MKHSTTFKPTAWIVFALFFGFLGTITAFAQKPQDRVAEKFGLSWKMAAELQKTLTPEQKAELFAKLPKNQDDFPPFMGGPGGRRGGMGRGPEPGFPMGGRALQGILTKEQATALRQKFASEMPGAQMRQQMMQEMADALNLTARQKADLENLHEDLQTKMMALHEKQGNGDRKAERDEMENIHNTFREAHDQILTAQQKEIVKIHQVLMHERRGNRQDMRHNKRGDCDRMGPDGMRGRMGDRMNGGRMGRHGGMGGNW